MRKNRLYSILMVLITLILIGGSTSLAATIKWGDSDNVDNNRKVDGYKIYYTEDKNALNKESMTLISSVEKDKFYYSLDSVSFTPKTTYYFAVTAFNAAGESELSNIKEYTPGDQTPPAPPIGLKAE